MKKFPLGTGLAVVRSQRAGSWLRRLVEMTACVTLLLALYVVPAHAKPSELGTNGRIAFGALSAPDLFTIREDGSDQQLLASLPQSPSFTALIRGVSFSDDGSRLAVLYEQIGTDTLCENGFAICWSIVMMDGDGSDQRFIYSSEEIGGGALALSPDGHRVAFTLVVGDTEPLFTIRSNGHDLTQVTAPGSLKVDVSPTWSPDGRSLAFQSNRDCCTVGTWSLYIVNVSNRRVRKVLPVGGNDLEPDWSPDGEKLLFIRTFDYPDFRIYSVDADGTNEQEILADFSAAEIPHWSPDGEKILYQRNAGTSDLSVVDATGANSHVVYSGGSLGFDWRPND